jgi:predicted regulator of Ras-like GTPase activity (Roadblock/LC7/MglB family)
MSAAPPAGDGGLGALETVSEPQPVGGRADIPASDGTESAATVPLDVEERDPSAYLTALGSALRPAFSLMVGRIPKLRYAVLCTPDGFNVCSTGVGNEQIGKMAAISSSLLVVGEALVNAATGQTELDVLTMESQGVQIVSTRISANGHSIILLICARTPLGVILVNVKSAVPELRARMELVN